MSATLFKKVDYSLAKLIHDIEQGEIGLPDIQRPFICICKGFDKHFGQGVGV